MRTVASTSRRAAGGCCVRATGVYLHFEVHSIKIHRSLYTNSYIYIIDTTHESGIQKNKAINILEISFANHQSLNHTV